MSFLDKCLGVSCLLIVFSTIIGFLAFCYIIFLGFLQH